MAHSDSSLSIVYVCDDHHGNDGGQIFDKRLINALQERGLAVDVRVSQNTKSFNLPFWSKTPTDLNGVIDSLDRIKTSLVVSHEKFFGLVQNKKVDAIIVHNYFPAFEFPGRHVVQRYYTAFSQPFYRRAFKNAGHVFFVSYRDYRRAIEDFPEISNKCTVIPPPPHRRPLSDRRLDVIHVSGSDNWLPKKLSALTVTEIFRMQRAGFKVRDFGDTITPAFGLIHDRFSVGFKLKLMQMLYAGDVIASFADVQEEITQICPGYPYFRQIQTLGEALEWYSEVRNQGVDRIDREINQFRDLAALPDWINLASVVMQQMGLTAE
jgi:hypothetical protein